MDNQKNKPSPEELTLQFYVWSSLIFQSYEFELVLPVFKTKPLIQKPRSRYRAELGRVKKVLDSTFTKQEQEIMKEAATVFGQALTCSVMNSKATTEILDQLYETLKAKQNECSKMD